MSGNALFVTVDTKNRDLDIARKRFEMLVNGQVDALNGPTLDNLLFEFNSFSLYSGADKNLTLLDPTGKKTSNEIEKEIEAGKKLCNLVQARQIFQYFTSDSHYYLRLNLDGAVKFIDTSLKEAGKGYGDLAPPLTADKAKAQIKELVHQGHISKARYAFAQLKEGNITREGGVTEMMEGRSDVAAKWLEQIEQVDIQQLDPKKTPAQIRAEIAAGTKLCYSKLAQEVLDDLGHAAWAGDPSMYTTPEGSKLLLDEYWPKAGIDPAKMQGIFKEKTTEFHISRARHALSHIENFYLETDADGQYNVNRGIETFLQEMHEELKKAGKELKALDPTGQCSNEDMQEEIHRAVKTAHIKNAQQYFKLAQQGVSVDGPMQKELQEICDELKAAGVDASALDETGKHNAQEMEEMLKKRAADFRLTPCIPPRVSNTERQK